jgi:hypothetical protein
MRGVAVLPRSSRRIDPQLGCDNFVVFASPVNYVLQHTVNEAKCIDGELNPGLGHLIPTQGVP